MSYEGKRCAWVTDDPLYIGYHDREWGVPTHDDLTLFEFLVLECFQAGLSWWTVLKKRKNFRSAFDSFDPEKVATYAAAKIDSLLVDSGIIRNRKKIGSAVTNAQAFLGVQNDCGSFDEYVWGFVGGRPILNAWSHEGEVPVYTPVAIQLSQDMKRRGFVFVGPTIAYAYMQATGLVNDHTKNCFRHSDGS
jgi:DNA-3-methyladenine glycosylase I